MTRPIVLFSFKFKYLDIFSALFEMIQVLDSHGHSKKGVGVVDWRGSF